MPVAIPLVVGLALCAAPLCAAAKLAPPQFAPPQFAEDDDAAPRAPTTPVASVRAAASALESQDLAALWELLPASYQGDVTRLTRQFARGLSPEVHAKGFELLDEFAGLLRSKRELLIRSELLRRGTRDDAELGARLDTLAELVQTLTDSTLARRDEFESLDVGVFLAESGNALARLLVELLVGPDGSDPEGLRKVGELLAAADFEVVETTARRARVRVSADPSGELDDDPFTLVEVEGRWLPEFVALAWNERVAELEQLLTTPETVAQRALALEGLARIESLFDQVAGMTRVEDLEGAAGGAFLSGMELLLGGAAVLTGRMQEAEVAGTRIKMENLRGAIMSYRRHHKRVPRSLDELTQPEPKNLDRPYVDRLDELHDAWGTVFHYVSYDTRTYMLTSYGADGVPGGEGVDADLVLP